MQERAAPVRAAIDIGSNTIHIVVARCKLHALDIIDDRVELVRIGESVTATGAISAQKRAAAIAVVKQFQQVAEQQGAERIFVVATEAIRQATNSKEFLEEVQQQTGLEVQLVSGSAEATLTFYGATYEARKQDNIPARLGVMDLGGGSTELVVAKNMRIVWRTSLPVGSGWLHDRYLRSDPPSPDDLSIAETFLHTYLQGLRLKWQPALLIVTGGSANSLLLLAQRAFKHNMQDHRLTYNELLHCEGLLNALDAEEISRRYGQPIGRAQILPAGALIIREMMARLNLHEIIVSPHGIREGVLLAHEQYGEPWLAWVNAEASAANHHEGSPLKYEDTQESFIHAGRRILKERVEKLLDWREEVLRNEDIEAVHKMRVASRRLRATLDAFQACCEPRRFKKAYRSVQRMADMLGEVRDTDVILQGLRTRLQEVPAEEHAGLEWLIQRLDTYRQQKQQEMEDFFKTLDERALRQEVEQCIQEGATGDGKNSI